jgi:hypothetical protein
MTGLTLGSVLVRSEASHDDTLVFEEQPRELTLMYACLHPIAHCSLSLSLLLVVLSLFLLSA